MTDNRKYTPIPHEYLEEMEILSDEEYGRLIRALQHFSIYGETVDCPGNEKFFLKRVYNRELRYAEDFRKLRDQRAEAGKKGARKRWSHEEDDHGDFREPIAKDGKHSNPNPNPDPDPNPHISAAVAAGDKRGPEEAFPPPAPAAAPVEESLGTLVALVNRSLKIRLSSKAMEELGVYYSQLGRELCIYAVERCAEEKKAGWSYLRGILRQMKETGVRSVEEDHGRGDRGKPMQSGDGYERHGEVTLTPLEREAVRELLEEMN